MEQKNYATEVESYIEKHNSELGLETVKYLKTQLTKHKPLSEKDLNDWLCAVNHHISSNGRFEAE